MPFRGFKDVILGLLGGEIFGVKRCRTQMRLVGVKARLLNMTMGPFGFENEIFLWQNEI